MEFFWLTAGFAAGIFVGVRLAIAFHKHVILKILEDAGFTNEEIKTMTRRLEGKVKDVQSKDDLPKVDVDLEEQVNIFYAYRQDNGEFLAQAAEYKELIALIHKRLGNVTVLVDTNVIRKMPGYPKWSSLL